MLNGKKGILPGLVAALFAMALQLGHPAFSHAGYLPGENNPDLGVSIVMDPLTCAREYGVARCECFEMDDGTPACRYKSPPAGPYDSLEMCEEAWKTCQSTTDGAGNTIYYKAGSDETGTTMSCMGQIEIFAGEKFECRKSGLMTGGNNCCFETTGDECNFEKTAELLGYDSAIMMVAGQAIKIAMSKWSDSLLTYAGEKVTAYLIKTGSSETLSALVGLGNNFFQVTTEEIVEGALSKGTMSVYGQLAEEAVANALGSMVSFVGMVYSAYQLWQMYQQMQTCAVGEEILACKVGLGKCHYIGDKCKMKVFGLCLQKAKQYCCFSTKLARIIQEQGRAQLSAKGLDAPSWPDCRGLFPDEFGKIDFSSVDLSEYFADIQRQADVDLTDDFQAAIDRFSASGQVSSAAELGDVDEDREAEWVTGPWSACSPACGPSSRDRVVTCVYSDDGTAAPEAACDVSSWPGDTDLCEDETLCNYHWDYGDWSECDLSCYGGTRFRMASCLTGQGQEVADSRCLTAKPDPEIESCGGGNTCSTCKEVKEANPAIDNQLVTFSWGTAMCSDGWTGLGRLDMQSLGGSFIAVNDGIGGLVGGYPSVSTTAAGPYQRLHAVYAVPLPFAYESIMLDGFTVMSTGSEAFTFNVSANVKWDTMDWLQSDSDVAFGSLDEAVPAAYWSLAQGGHGTPCASSAECQFPGGQSSYSLHNPSSNFAIVFGSSGTANRGLAWTNGRVWLK